MSCPCCSHNDYLTCCEPFITGKEIPTRPEALMRSRYTAYTMANVAYVKATMKGEALACFNETEAKRWAKRVQWLKLHVIQSSLENSNTGFVEFEANFIDGRRLQSIHEKSQFTYTEGRWYYVSGTHLPSSYPERIVARNAPCPCGSLRKFKNCHGGRC